MIVCPTCSKKYKSIGSHWYHSPSHAVEFTDERKQILDGVLAADGTLSNRDNTPYLQIDSIQREYLEYLNNKFPIIGRGVVEVSTAKESCQSARSSGFSPNAREEDYSAVYRWRTTSHPHFNKYTNWYNKGNKNWINTNITLNPITLKHIFCGDGHYTGDRISISASNLSTKEKKIIRDKFLDVGIEVSSIYEQDVSKNTVKQSIIFTKHESEKMFEYMGPALPGFEYKWP